MKSTIYIGVTRLLKEPKVANGKVYPFGFDSDIPAVFLTSYRLIASSDPADLTDASLAEMLKASKHGKLMADFEKIEGRSLSWITIHPEGSNGTTGGRRGQFDQGPTLEMTKTLVPQPERTITQGKTPPPPDPELGMSF